MSVIYSQEIICPTPADSDALRRILSAIPNVWTVASGPDARGFVCRFGSYSYPPIEKLHAAWEQYIEGHAHANA